MRISTSFLLFSLISTPQFSLFLIIIIVELSALTLLLFELSALNDILWLSAINHPMLPTLPVAMVYPPIIFGS